MYYFHEIIICNYDYDNYNCDNNRGYILVVTNMCTMKWISHIALGMVICKALSIIFLWDLNYIHYAIICLFSILADIDSLIGIKHRTYTHTVYFAILLPLPLLFIDFPGKVDIQSYILGVTAYLSHLLGDMFNPSGVMLFYPKKTVYHALPSHLRFITGSNTEWFVLIGLIIISSSFMGFENNIQVSKVINALEENDIIADVTVSYKGLNRKLEDVKIVFTDGNKIGIIYDKSLLLIDKKDLKKIDVKEIVAKSKTEKVVRLSFKRLKNYNDGLIIAYSFDREVWNDFLGTGYDLYKKLRKDKKCKNCKIYIKVI